MSATPSSLSQRFWSKVDVGGENDCWPWMAYRLAGYGRFSAGDALGGPKIWPAHRVSFALTFGLDALTSNAELDHVCHTTDLSCVTGYACPHRACVNPAHLEPVTHHENALRREARRSTCVSGHQRTPENRGRNGTLGYTKCKVCNRLKEQNRRATGVYEFPGVA